MRRQGSNRFPVKVAFVIIHILAGALGAYASAQTRPPSISKVEPPSWWAEHSINPVRLLVRGKNLAAARVHTNNPAIKVSEVSVNRSATYIFVSVTIAGVLSPGSYPLIER